VELMGLYRRESEMIDGQPYDVIDGRPFSTEFSFTRFLVPALNMYEGKALFMDSDMYVRADINELFDICSMDVHFTTGGPWFNAWKPRGEIEGKYAVEWCNDAQWLQMNNMIDPTKDYMI
jgi:hypothetical protein